MESIIGSGSIVAHTHIHIRACFHHLANIHSTQHIYSLIPKFMSYKLIPLEILQLFELSLCHCWSWSVIEFLSK